MSDVASEQSSAEQHRIAGLPGRILLSVMGLVVALLSATGIVIWFKKRAARRAALIRR